ncbi:alpha/beta hydrolase [Amycolatopsis sp.]|uniref:alpha/beta fold hydrolase n=1 Tax=Amycolatopsis sp. TaxID=37632 RepID=UPI002CD1B481|nr:alpha/beta hydrolase [Amycolatopsis sp.]HVV08461.1 alpha/beta hydrolase [Amycolatopsis sp.]
MTPRWFTDALAHPPEHRETAVGETRVHLRCWGAPGSPGLVLVHGGSANSGWWDHIAPFFAGSHRVVAPDLSGHGDSSWRKPYDLAHWGREVVAAADAGGIDGPFCVVGHSMGGWVAATAGARHGDRVHGVAIIDSPLNDRPPEEERLRERRRPTRIYADRAEILGRFRTVPAQDVLLPYVREHIAEESIRRVDGGWTWKFDPMLYGSREPLRELLPRLDCRTAFLRSEFGLVPPAMFEEIRKLLDHRALLAELPDAGHHPMLDQPLPLVTALRVILAQWALA